MALDRALIDRAEKRLAIPLGERRGKRDVDADAGDVLSIPLRCHRQGETRRVEVALLAEAQRVETGAGADRGEKQVEGRRGFAATSL